MMHGQKNIKLYSQFMARQIHNWNHEKLLCCKLWTCSDYRQFVYWRYFKSSSHL